MPLFGIFLIIALIAAAGYLYYRYDLMKAYYKYQTKELETLEKKYDDQVSTSTKRIDELQNIAYINATTNIWNIDYFLTKGAEAFAAEYETPPNFTLIAFNISNIGKINQLFGPTEGDKVVYYTAQTLSKTAGRHIYAQIYSNLFCILTVNCDDTYVTNLIQTLSDRLMHYDDNVQIKAAFGIYKILDTKEKIMDMVNCATLAQKFVKENDEVCYKFFTNELNETFLTNKKMSEEMEQALDDHKFMMYLQPMYDLHSYKIISAEALVRWDYPGKGILSPYAFLPLFESTSLIQKLDYYMWEECLKTIRHWIDNKIEPTPITMNISPTHLQNEKFIDYLIELSDRYLIRHDMLVLEIPERGLSNVTDQVKNIIERLHKEGFILCIDNFGSLNSPLNLLKDLPIDRIKLDRSFLSKNANSEEGLTILRYLIAMAKELDFTVITEGIETEEQANFLLEIGCDIGQGYHFSKPVDLKSFDQLNKTLVSALYRPDEYYPTFEDYERDLDLIVQFFKTHEEQMNIS